MSIKSDLIAAITGFADGGNNPASEFRTFMTNFLGTVYPTPIEVISSATTYATATSNSNFPYRFLFTKVGRRIHIDGHFRNATTGTVANQVLCTITDAELKVSVAQSNGFVLPYYGTARDLTNGLTVYFKIYDVAGVTTFEIVGNMSATSAGYEIISGTYNTLN